MTNPLAEWAVESAVMALEAFQVGLKLGASCARLLYLSLQVAKIPPPSLLGRLKSGTTTTLRMQIVEH